MWTWIVNNISTIIIGMLLLGAIVFIIVKYILGKKKNKNKCPGCAGCAFANKCPRANLNK